MKKFVPDIICAVMILCAYIFFFSMAGCTENTRVKKMGGKMTVDLPANQKLINVTWKETDIWILTKPMTSKDSVEIYNFTEKSTLGILEGEITFKETR